LGFSVYNTSDLFYNCVAHKSSDGNLLTGDDRTALIDCGMAFCAGQTIESVERALKDKPLDYIFLTHSHYDHMGALPFFRKHWPGLKVACSQATAAIMLKDSPRRAIRELAAAAGKMFSANYEEYAGDDAFYADIILNDTDVTRLGGLSIEALAAPGHTRDSYCFFVPELELLLLNETPGVLVADGVYPCYLTSYADTIDSIEKCRRVDFSQLSLPHRGLVDKKDAEGFFEKALRANISCHEFIRNMSLKGYDLNQMMDAFYDRYFSETLMQYQPKEAYMVNTRATISCSLREPDAH
jgi:glyoxylase-like metal-dependent hydrolase (beta-lactamase superfamily II)